MNRRHLFSAAVALSATAIPIAGLAQTSPEAIAQVYLGTLASRDWDRIDQIMATDFQPRYSSSNEEQLPGRDAWKQRAATDLMFTMIDNPKFELQSVAQSGNTLFIFAEYGDENWPKGEVLPLVSVFDLEGGLIVSGYTSTSMNAF